MTTYQGSSPHEKFSLEKQSVALTSVAAAILLTTLKMTVGIFTGSL